jgi:hypothetical protein
VKHKFRKREIKISFARGLDKLGQFENAGDT